ncbi:ferredoxin family protein [Parvibacter caecicola]|uniref:Ferredoxin family protein n=1 Tax=Parvibacter caecicola TaxID=747645 RepID=A0A4T9TE16_9ACTN|nr:ferredoxin family protein [Parvibacter caecicola]TJW10762.1 ferredoxin family protein [Parvibacter caecicola]
MIDPIDVNVDEKLSLNRYEVDEENAHIRLKDEAECPNFQEEFDKLIIACPAALYRRDEEGRPSFDYAGCLECGTCRIICSDTILDYWRYPGPTMGVEYRWG